MQVLNSCNHMNTEEKKGIVNVIQGSHRGPRELHLQVSEPPVLEVNLSAKS